MMESSNGSAPTCRPDTPDLSEGKQNSTDTSLQGSKLGFIKYALSQVSNAGKFVWKIVTSHFGLFIILIGYTFAGATMMLKIETYYIEKQKQEQNMTYPPLKDFREYFVNTTIQDNWNESGIPLEDMYEVLLQYEKEKEAYQSEIPREYDFWEWLLFCLTVYSTIGYGAIYPSTTAGRMATMAYATIGVPLFLLTIGKVGKLFTRGVKYVWSFIRRFYYLKQFRRIRKTQAVQTITSMKIPESQQQENSSDPDTCSFVSFKIDDEFNLPPLIAILITVVYIILGAIMYVQWEKDWTYQDAFYFIFISVSTIGFGDLVPSRPKFFLLSSIYILFGLALVAMVIHVLMEFFTETIQSVRDRMHIPEILRHPSNIMSGKYYDEEISPTDLKAGIGKLALNFQHVPIQRNAAYVRRSSIV